MKSILHRGAVVVLLMCAVACGPSGPTSPSVSQPPPAPTPTPPLISFPPPSGPARTFIFKGELGYPVRDFTRQSRLILYDNGAFVLQYPPSSFGNGALRGQYEDADGVMMFIFETQGRTVDEAWEDATGTLRGDSLTIQFDEMMQQSDFENAVYALMH